MVSNEKNFAAKLLHVGVETNAFTRAVSTPIYQVSTFHQNIDQPEEYEYSRSGNLTRKELETIIAELEGGIAGFASDIAAISMVLFEQGDHILVPKDVYDGTYRLGGGESILSYPVSISHAAIELQVRQELGTRDGLPRLSVGLEDADDLLADLASAMED